MVRSWVISLGSRSSAASPISQIWHTEDFRPQPTPVDEARWGFAVIENSLWDAVPQFLRQIDAVCEMTRWHCPGRIGILYSSWIGGDRDGNPNVTAAVTRQVLLLAQWQACSSSTMWRCSRKALCDHRCAQKPGNGGA